MIDPRRNEVMRVHRLEGWSLCDVPTILRKGPYRFYFHSADRGEPPHVHVQRDRQRAKVWLSFVQVSWNRGFGPHEILHVTGIVQEHRDELLGRWHEYFGD